MPDDPNLDQLSQDIPPLLSAVAKAVAMLAAGAANAQPDPRAADLHNQINAALNTLNAAINTATGGTTPAPVPSAASSTTAADVTAATGASS